MAATLQHGREAKQVFSYHLIPAPLLGSLARLISSRRLNHVPGLRHSEFLLPMKMGHPVTSPGRYRWGALAFFGFWDCEDDLDAFLDAPPYRVLEDPAWCMRMRFYRRWGSFGGLEDAIPATELGDPDGPVAAVTLARLRLTQTLRFARYGKPVEEQVRDHPGLRQGAVAFRPLSTFSTFSHWESEAAMLNMVGGEHAKSGRGQHQSAMVERARKPFHYEFTTMRFVPISTHGQWPWPESAVEGARR